VSAPTVVLVRHGATEWSISGQHTSRTDLPLTEDGRRNAECLRPRLAGRHLALVLTSPLRRARETCELAGLGARAELSEDLLEWDYGEYEGVTTLDIRAKQPRWSLWMDGAPGGETAADVAVRVDRLLKEARELEGDVLLFSHGHVLRVLAARWLGLEPSGGRYLVLGTASLSELGYEHSLEEPVIRLWNEVL
jgi:probable phosphoglycerate mutase